MDWIRENKSLAVILGVILAASAALAYLLFGAWSRFTETRDSYLALGSQVAALNSLPLAPTDANVKAKKTMIDEYAANVNKLAGALLILQPPSVPIKDIEFQAKLKEKIANVRQKAALAQMTLPSDFAFGFEDYTSGLAKSAEAATELSRYLDATDELVALFMNCGVQSLDLFERSKLAIETEKSGAQGQPMQQGPAPILEKRQISVVLTLDQGPLQLLISRLANPSDVRFFTSVRLMRIENERQEGPIRVDTGFSDAAAAPPPPAVTEAVGDGAEVKTDPDEIRPPAPAAPDSVPIIGEERLKVSLEIDLIKFLEAAKGMTAQATTR